MKVGKFIVYFAHNSERAEESNGVSRCIITNDEKIPIVETSSVAGKKEHFNKSMGAAISFTRAVNTFDDRKLRKALWEGLKIQCPHVFEAKKAIKFKFR